MTEVRLFKINQLAISELKEKKMAKKIEIKIELRKETIFFGFIIFVGGRWVSRILIMPKFKLLFNDYQD